MFVPLKMCGASSDVRTCIKKGQGALSLVKAGNLLTGGWLNHTGGRGEWVRTHTKETG